MSKRNQNQETLFQTDNFFMGLKLYLASNWHTGGYIPKHSKWGQDKIKRDFLLFKVNQIKYS